MTLWMDRRRSEYIAPSAPKIDTGQNAGTIPHPSGLHVPMEAVACPNHRALCWFPPGPCVLEGIDRILAIKINYIEAEAGSRSEVGRRIRQCPAEWWALRLVVGVYSPLSIAAMPPVSLVGLRWAMDPSDRFHG
jgi:hypothetical protein